MDIDHIVLASLNQNKLKEFESIFSPKGIKVSLASDFNLKEQVEDGISFEENALIKAKYASKETSLVALSDDSGFEIKELDNYPSINSARVAKELGSYEKVFQDIESKLEQKGLKTSKARFICVLCLYFPNDNYYFFKGVVEGDLFLPPIGENGFAYDKIFIPSGYDKTFAELLLEEKNKLSHRYKAIKKLKEFLNI